MPLTHVELENERTKMRLDWILMPFVDKKSLKEEEFFKLVL